MDAENREELDANMEAENREEVDADMEGYHSSDSAVDDLNDEVGSSGTTTIAESLWDFPVEYGRTYHAAYHDIFYPFPNDEAEQMRLDFKHDMYQHLTGRKLHLCPAETASRVLDVGTGTGIWAMDYADLHPEASVTGIDISPIQPEWVAPNCGFEICDILAPWTFTTKFDFIYARDLFASLPDPKRFIREAFNHLEPSGWFEIEDSCLPTSDDQTIPYNGSLAYWIDGMCTAIGTLDRDQDLAQKYGDIMLDVGFVRVQKVRQKVPINTWPRDARLKEVGAYNLENLSRGLEGLSLRLLRKVLGWPEERLNSLLAGVRRELADKRIHAYTPVYTYYGQKPPETEEMVESIETD